MARILCISSQVARGTVGLSVIVPALQRLDHDVIALPTVVLSNHPGHAHVAGMAVPAGTLEGMREALEANGWLGGVDGVLSGYLPSREHVRLVAETVAHIKAVRTAQGRTTTYLCDPVLGDDPKGLYIDAGAAEAIGAELMPIADIVTPNRFELEFLARRVYGAPVRTAEEARAALACLDAGIRIATSIPSGQDGEICNVMVAGGWMQTRVPIRPQAPHGTGDLFAALMLGSMLAAGGSASAALADATAGVDRVLEASAGQDQLALCALEGRTGTGANWPVESQRDVADGRAMARSQSGA